MKLGTGSLMSRRPTSLSVVVAVVLVAMCTLPLVAAAQVHLQPTCMTGGAIRVQWQAPLYLHAETLGRGLLQGKCALTLGASGVRSCSLVATPLTIALRVNAALLPLALPPTKVSGKRLAAHNVWVSGA